MKAISCPRETLAISPWSLVWDQLSYLWSARVPASSVLRCIPSVLLALSTKTSAYSKMLLCIYIILVLSKHFHTFLWILTVALWDRPGSCSLALFVLPKRKLDAEESGGLPKVTKLLRPRSQTWSQSRAFCPHCQTQRGCYQPICVTILVRILGEPASLPPPSQRPIWDFSPEV